MRVPKKESCIYSTVQKFCMRKKWRKKLLRCKNTQATARSKSAIILRFTRKNFETQEVKNLHRKKLENSYN